jgi:hypothetical protein
MLTRNGIPFYTSGLLCPGRASRHHATRPVDSMHHTPGLCHHRPANDASPSGSLRRGISTSPKWRNNIDVSDLCRNLGERRQVRASEVIHDVPRLAR